jgi:hypothetical protein
MASGGADALATPLREWAGLCHVDLVRCLGRCASPRPLADGGRPASPKAV